MHSQAGIYIDTDLILNTFDQVRIVQYGIEPIPVAAHAQYDNKPINNPMSPTVAPAYAIPNDSYRPPNPTVRSMYITLPDNVVPGHSYHFSDCLYINGDI